MNQYIFGNILKAIDVLHNTPQSKVDLGKYRIDEPCGTIACLLGHLSMDPYFAEKGVILEPLKQREDSTVFYVPADNIDKALDALFGPNCFPKLFQMYGCGNYDEKLLEMLRHDRSMLVPPDIAKQVEDAIEAIRDSEDAEAHASASAALDELEKNFPAITATFEDPTDKELAMARLQWHLRQESLPHE